MEQVWYNHGFGDAFLLKDIEVGNKLKLVSKSTIDIYVLFCTLYKTFCMLGLIETETLNL